MPVAAQDDAMQTIGQPADSDARIVAIEERSSNMDPWLLQLMLEVLGPE